jgi:hypothetical protein
VVAKSTRVKALLAINPIHDDNVVDPNSPLLYGEI